MATDTLITLATILAAGIGGPTILLAVMNSRFADMNNRFVDMNNRIADINKRVDERFVVQAELMRQGFDDVNKRFDDVNKRFDDVNKRIDDVNKRIDDVNSRLDDVNKRLDDHGFRLSRIEDGYIDIAQRVSRLEGRIGLSLPPAAEPEAAALPTES